LVAVSRKNNDDGEIPRESGGAICLRNPPVGKVRNIGKTQEMRGGLELKESNLWISYHSRDKRATIRKKSRNSD